MPHSQNEAPVHLAGRTLGPNLHICGFFRDLDEEYRVLLPFIQEGFEHGEKAFHIVDPARCADHLSRLEAFGIKASEHQRSGSLELLDWNGAYLPDGGFDPDRMLALWVMVFDAAKRLGYPRTRVIGHAEWALESELGVNGLLEYEARFNLLPPHDNPVICTYDLTRFGGDVIMDVIRTHPLIIVGGLLQENPFYTPPDRFLRELRERATSDPSHF